MVSVRGVRLLLVTLVVVTCGSGCRAAPAPASAVPVVLSAGGGSAADERKGAPAEPLGASVASTHIAGMSMQMTFFGSNKFDLWFKSFNVHDAGTLTAACLGVAVMAVLYEGLKVGRIILVDKIDSSKLSSSGHWLQVFLHIVQVTCSYFLMLATMTYSSWIMIAVCAGAGLGYAVFAPLVSKSALLGGSNEHCHH